MVDLPAVNNTIPELRAPTSRVSPGQIAEPYNELARNLDRAGQALSEDVARPLARQAAATAVTRDEQGNIQIDRPPIVGDAAVDYGRAVKVAAAAEGENEFRQRNIEMRLEHKDDPAGYQKAAAEYKKSIKTVFKAAGPEVVSTLERTFDRMSIETHGGLLNEKEGRDLKRATTAIEAQIETTKNEMVALANGGDTSSDDFKQRAAKIDALYGELVRNPRLAYPKEKADLERRQFDAELKGQALAHTIAKGIYDDGGEEAAKKAAETILTDPTLQLTAGQRDAFYNRAMGAIQKRANEEKRADKSIETDLDDIDKIVSEGYAPTTARMADLKASIDTAKDPAIKERYATTLATIPVMKAWRQMSPAQLDQELSRLSASMREKGTSAEGLALLKNGDKLLKTMQKQVADDPLGWADRTGAFQVPPINFADKSAPFAMKDRISTAETIARHYGITPRYLTPEETKFLETQGAAGGNAMLGLAQQIANGFGDRAQKVLAEVSGQAPILAHMGGLLTGSLFGGGSTTFANDVAEAVQLRQNKDFKLPRWLDHPSDKILTAQNAKTLSEYGDAFVMAPNNGRAAEASAQAAYFARANRQGLSALVDDSKSETAYQRTLQEGAGATYAPDGTRYGGVVSMRKGQRGVLWSDTGKVLIPGTVRADKFEQVIGAVTDEDLRKLPISPQTIAGKPYTAADLKGSLPVAVPGGYRFAQGDPSGDNPKWLRGADGMPFVLPFDAMEGELRKRVPGAFVGGR